MWNIWSRRSSQTLIMNIGSYRNCISRVNFRRMLPLESFPNTYLNREQMDFLPSSTSRHFFTYRDYWQKEDIGDCSNQELKKKSVENKTTKCQKVRILTIPNVLTISRISLSPLLSYHIIQENYSLSLVFLIGLGMTDFFDGYIARNFKGQASEFGSFLDPLGDKILIISLYSSMAYMNLLPGILMGVIVLRDVLLLAAGGYIRFISIPPPRTIRKYFDSSSSSATLHPTMISKVNTAIQLITAVVSLYAPLASWITHDHLSVLWYMAGCSTITSGISYLFSKNTYKFKK